jgi:metal-responsive CopG/Arc/MetJ family transcriptional regulator
MARRKMSDNEKKSNLTININENLLKKFDNLIENDGDKRSRLIERLLKEYIEQNKNKLDEDL